jgi:ankyrin repeat domain-containing protein 50
VFQQFDALWNIFVRLIEKEKHLSTTIIIDAIDECEEKARNLILRHLFKLVKNSRSLRIKILITCRSSAESLLQVPQSGFPLLLLSFEEESARIAQDVNFLVQHHVERLIQKGSCRASMRDNLENMLLFKADATFLWIQLILPILNRRRFLLESDISAISKNMPKGLQSLYLGLLSEIHEDDRPLAAKILKLIAATDRPLTAGEMSILLTIGPETKSTLEFIPEAQLVDDRSIQSLLGSLVRKRYGSFYLVHQSLKDYLISHAALLTSMDVFSVDVVREKRIIADACLCYLTLKECSEQIHLEDEIRITNFNSIVASQPADEDILLGLDLFQNADVETSESYEAAWNRIASRLGLFDYAALHWPDYLSLASDTIPPLSRDLALKVYEARNGYANHWFRYYWLRKMQPDPFPSQVDPLMIASFFGHTDVARYILQAGRVDSEAIKSSLCWAARRNQAGCLKAILSFATTFQTMLFEQHPILIVAQHGHLQSLLVLLEDGRTDLNTQDKKGRTPLALAAAGAHVSALEMILQYTNLDVNLSDHTESGPLHWAVAAESTTCIARLLEHPMVIRDSKDTKGRNILSWAAEYGNLEVVALLLIFPSININDQDKLGRTPLSYASQYGHLEIVRLLCSTNGIDILCRGFAGRTCHSWAAHQRSTATLYELLVHSPEGADIADIDGWTPIAWTSDPPGYEENALALIQSNVNINHCDKNGRSILSWVASYGYVLLLSELLRLPYLELDAKDDLGWTALTYAVTAGNLEVVKMLLQTGQVDINARDKAGYVPLAQAARSGHLEVVAILIDAIGIDLLAKDLDGHDLESIARKYNHPDVANLIAAKFKATDH